MLGGLFENVHFKNLVVYAVSHISAGVYNVLVLSTHRFGLYAPGSIDTMFELADPNVWRRIA